MNVELSERTAAGAHEAEERRMVQVAIADRGDGPGADDKDVVFELQELSCYYGAFRAVRDISLDLGHGMPREPVPVQIYIGPTGPMMTELTGEIADGAILNGILSPQYTAFAVERLKAGGAKRGGLPPGFE